MNLNPICANSVYSLKTQSLIFFLIFFLIDLGIIIIGYTLILKCRQRNTSGQTVSSNTLLIPMVRALVTSDSLSWSIHLSAGSLQMGSNTCQISYVCRSEGFRLKGNERAKIAGSGLRLDRVKTGSTRVKESTRWHLNENLNDFGSLTCPVGNLSQIYPVL